MIRKWAGYGLMVLVLSGCVSTRTQTWQADEFEQRHQHWRYYRWSSSPLPEGQAGEAMVAIDRAVRAQLDATLTERGYQRDSTLAQFAVDYRIGGDSAVGLPGPLSPTDEAERILAGPNAEYEVSSRFYTHRTLGYQEFGHLKLSVYDIGSKRIVWQSSASKLVDDPGASPARLATEMSESTRKLLQQFPAAVPR